MAQSNKLLIYKIRNYEVEIKNIIIDNFIINDLDTIIKLIDEGFWDVSNFLEVPTNYSKSKEIKNQYTKKYNEFLCKYQNLKKIYNNCNINDLKEKSKNDVKIKHLLKQYNLSRLLIFHISEKYEFFSPFNYYIKRVKKLKKRIKKYKDLLIEKNMSLVNHIASTYTRNNIFTLMDLIQEGTLGLVKAINIIDCNCNIELSTYSYYWISHYISLFIFKKNNLISVPVHILKKLNRVKRITQMYLETNAEEPDIKELSFLTGLKESELKKLSNSDLIINTYDCSDESTVFNYISDINQEEYNKINDLREVISKNLEILNPYEKYVIAKEFDLQFVDIDEDLIVKDKKYYKNSALEKLRALDNWL